MKIEITVLKYPIQKRIQFTCSHVKIKKVATFSIYSISLLIYSDFF